jgi:transcriptional regulator with XRE-family HTH domain
MQCERVAKDVAASAPEVGALRATLGRSIRRELARVDISIARLAAVAGCSRPYAHAVIEGRVGVGIDLLDDFANALGCAPADLLRDHEPPRTRVCAPPTRNSTSSRRILASNLGRWASERELMPVHRLAQRSGVSATQLYAILGARVSASIDRLAPLSHALAIGATRLLEPSAPPR